jgi:uncharacterized protein YbjT (DUF2867 family)
VAIAGASGLVGQQILLGLLADESVGEVHALCRRDLKLAHPKLVVHLVDFNHLPALPALDEVYLALGTTIGQAGSRTAFYAVDFTASLAVARQAVRAGASRVALVSSAGANARSWFFYNRVKGELEEALASLPLHTLLIARPSLLLGDRAGLGQQSRMGELWMAAVLRRLGNIVPLGWRAVPAGCVAAALLANLPAHQGRIVLSSARIQTFQPTV